MNEYMRESHVALSSGTSADEVCFVPELPPGRWVWQYPWARGWGWAVCNYRARRGSQGFSPLSSLRRHVRTIQMIAPASGIRSHSRFHALLSVSCKPRTLTASDGAGVAAHRPIARRASASPTCRYPPRCIEERHDLNWHEDQVVDEHEHPALPARRAAAEFNARLPCLSILSHHQVLVRCMYWAGR